MEISLLWGFPIFINCHSVQTPHSLLDAPGCHIGVAGHGNQPSLGSVPQRSLAFVLHSRQLALWAVVVHTLLGSILCNAPVGSPLTRSVGLFHLSHAWSYMDSGLAIKGSTQEFSRSNVEGAYTAKPQKLSESLRAPSKLYHLLDLFRFHRFDDTQRITLNAAHRASRIVSRIAL
jgi:hypothetical protein